MFKTKYKTIQASNLIKSKVMILLFFHPLINTYYIIFV